MDLRERLSELEDATGGMEGRMIHPFYQGAIFFLTLLLVLWAAVTWLVGKAFRLRRRPRA